jgi:hypothetical protein
LGLSNTFCFTF